MEVSTDKIRILLIDDEPKNLCGEEIWRYPLAMNDPDCLLKYSDLFEVRFLATAEEAREFRDRSLLLASKAEMLSLDGWLPEIVVADYMLTGNPTPIEARAHYRSHFEELSPLPSLRRNTAEQLEVSTVPAKFNGAQIPQEHESYGCFIAGLISSTFSDHPCALVTRTKRKTADLRGTYVEYFQWLMANQVSNWLQPEEPTPREWKDVLKIAAPRVRKRIEELARQKLVAISLQDLMTLADNGDHDVLTIESRYGIRRLPVRGLFCDYLNDGFKEEAQKFARRLLQDRLHACVATGHTWSDAEFENSIRELKDAIQLSQAVWNGYLDEERMLSRFELASLCAQLKAAKEVNSQRLKELMLEFGLSEADLKKPKPSLKREVAEIRMVKGCLVRRWAALMIIVRLLKWAITAHRNYSRALPPRSATQVGRGKPGQNRLFDELQEMDVYLALFPISRAPITLQNITSLWARELDRWNDARYPEAKNGYNLCLDIQNALDGEGWHEEGNKLNWRHGLRSGERQLLREYALGREIDFPEAEWNDQARRFFKGKPS